MSVNTPVGDFQGEVMNPTIPSSPKSDLSQKALESSREDLPKAENILEEANRIVGGARNKDYGSPLANFTQTAALINAAFGTSFIAEDIPILMILLKVSRHRNKRKRDNLVDIAGYARTAEMVADERDGHECSKEAHVKRLVYSGGCSLELK